MRCSIPSLGEVVFEIIGHGTVATGLSLPAGTGTIHLSQDGYGELFFVLAETVFFFDLKWRSLK